MKKIFFLCLTLIGIHLLVKTGNPVTPLGNEDVLNSSFASYKGKNLKILVFSATRAFRHKSIPAGKVALIKMAKEEKWQIDTTEQVDLFDFKKLKKYDVLVFLNTSGNIFNNFQKEALKKYIHKGGGYVGIHAASDTEKEWPWYNDLVGGLFESHPKAQNLTYYLNDATHPTTNFLDPRFERFEEIYNFYNFKKDLVNVLISADETTYEGGKMGAEHPSSWYHCFEGGRSFFTAWGHHPETYEEQKFLEHVKQGIIWAGDKKSCK